MNNTPAYAHWNLPEGAIARLGKGWISDIAYSPDGKLLAVCAGTGIWLYDAADCAETALLSIRSEEAVAAAFSPDGKTIAAAYDHSMARLWDVQTGEISDLFENACNARSAAFSPDGTRILFGCRRRSSIALAPSLSLLPKRTMPES